MALKTDKNVKLYYSIKEVAEEVGVNESTLRYWEKEFPFLKPKVTSNKVRQYTEKDIEQASRLLLPASICHRTGLALRNLQMFWRRSSVCAMS